MPHLALRDRDAIVTPEGLIFRVFGYNHPPNGFICDLEYAPEHLFKSNNPKALRLGGFYKFYEDEAWTFLKEKFPKYFIIQKPLGLKVIGVDQRDIAEIKRPHEALQQILAKPIGDKLIRALHEVLDITAYSIGIPIEDFGVFGSLLHGFYHPDFSDIDLVVYGRDNLQRIRCLLQELYKDKNSGFYNEFCNDSSVRGKHWRYKNLSMEEFVWHQRRKLIYGVFIDKPSNRHIKVEFEPVKKWSEIYNEYGEIKKVMREGWIKAILRVKDDSDAPFIPSTYIVEPIKIIEGPSTIDLKRVVSYLEEYRMQAWKDEVIYVEGNLEFVETSHGSFHQITITYGPRYYEQVIKVINEGY